MSRLNSECAVCWCLYVSSRLEPGHTGLEHVQVTLRVRRTSVVNQVGYACPASVLLAIVLVFGVNLYVVRVGPVLQLIRSSAFRVAWNVANSVGVTPSRATRSESLMVILRLCWRVSSRATSLYKPSASGLNFIARHIRLLIVLSSLVVRLLLWLLLSACRVRWRRSLL